MRIYSSIQVVGSSPFLLSLTMQLFANPYPPTISLSIHWNCLPDWLADVKEWNVAVSAKYTFHQPFQLLFAPRLPPRERQNHPYQQMESPFHRHWTCTQLLPLSSSLDKCVRSDRNEWICSEQQSHSNKFAPISTHRNITNRFVWHGAFISSDLELQSEFTYIWQCVQPPPTIASHHSAPRGDCGWIVNGRVAQLNSQK